MNREQFNSKKTALTKCIACGSEGWILHANLIDRLFGATGKWDIKKCCNHECGHLWLDPVPTDNELSNAYENYYTHQDKLIKPESFARSVYERIKNGYLSLKFKYAIEGVTLLDRILAVLIYLHPTRRMAFDASIFHLKAVENGTLLEIGCGSGEALKRMSVLGWNVKGVDFDSNAVKNAQAKGLNVKEGELADQLCESDAYDAIIMSHVIEHVPRPLELLSECYRILKPGGKLIVLTPNANSWGHAWFGQNWRGLEPPRHLHIFSVNSLSSLAENAGFEKINCRALAQARNMFLASQSLKRAGGLDDNILKSKKQRLFAEVAELLEWITFSEKLGKGEEITMICEK